LIPIDFGKMKKILLRHIIMQSNLTVEETLDVSIDAITKTMKAHKRSSGKFEWQIGEWEDAELRWGFRPINSKLGIDFTYRFDTEPVVKQRVNLLATNTNFGGKRLWFECPAFIHGNACKRRVGKLYIPPGGKYLGCRHCYCLTYRSSQEAHYPERLAKELAKLWGITPDLAKELTDGML